MRLHMHTAKRGAAAMIEKSTAATRLPEGKKPHHVTLQDRSALTATGIQAVLAYDAFSAMLATEYGTLTVGGEGLTVSELSVQTGEVKIQGAIEYMQYTAKKEKAESIFKRLVR
jgi:sporulation protein YabP